MVKGNLPQLSNLETMDFVDAYSAIVNTVSGIRADRNKEHVEKVKVLYGR